MQGGAAGEGPQLSLHQSIVKEEAGEPDTALLDKINNQIVRGETGRLFSVVFLRGKQHKVTPGESHDQSSLADAV
jgi:hypothetical protein